MSMIQYPSYDLTGKCALVTGAGSGIGRAAALLLAHYGAKVAACDISGERTNAVVHEILEEALPVYGCGSVYYRYFHHC